MTQSTRYSNQTMGGGEKTHQEIPCTPTLWTCWNKNYWHTSQLWLVAHHALVLHLKIKHVSTMEDTNLANKASERAKTIRKNKDFYDLNRSNFTSCSKDGDVDRALENKRARFNATATEQKVDLPCTCKSLLLRSY